MQKVTPSRLTAQSLIALILVCTVSVALAGGEAIGFAVASGSFQVDSAQVYGNTTLFDGATISTATAPSRLELTNGARMTLGEDSQARIFDKQMTLERGTGELKTPASYRMDARTLQISPLDPKSIARVKLEGPRQVLVAAVNGRVRVLNEAGTLVANVEPGRALLFTPQAAEAGTFKMSGCLLESADGKFFLMDPNQTVELRGSGLSAEANNHVDIIGTAFRSAVPAPPASQVVQVDTGELKQTAVGGCEESISKLESSGVKVAKPGQPVKTAAVEHPKSHIGIYAGVGVAVAAGIGAAVALGGKKSTSAGSSPPSTAPMSP
jgi:hypothetical protein